MRIIGQETNKKITITGIIFHFQAKSLTFYVMNYSGKNICNDFVSGHKTTNINLEPAYNWSIIANRLGELYHAQLLFQRNLDSPKDVSDQFLP